MKTNWLAERGLLIKSINFFQDKTGIEVSQLFHINCFT
jgi:hypothetical protein